MTRPSTSEQLHTRQTASPVVALNPQLAGVKSSPVRDLLAVVADPRIISFAGGIPDPAFFDVEGLHAAFDHVLTKMPHRALQYAASDGEPELREIAAQRLTDEGIASTVADVLITTGSQQGISLVGQALLGAGDTVLVEMPTYLAALQSFSATGATAVGVPGDGDGMLPDALEAAILAHHPKVVYLVPTFRNPTGDTMSTARRREIADVIARHQVMLVEDDPYSELRFRGESVAPISSDPRLVDRSVALKTLSKIVAPGLRIGWLRAPNWLLPALVVAKQAADLHNSTVDQLAAAHYLQATDLNARLDRVRASYGRRRDAMIAALPQALPSGSRFTEPDGGMFTWVELPEGMDSRAQLARAIEAGVAYVPGYAFFADGGGANTMRVSYVTNDEDTIRVGLQRLSQALNA